MTTVEEFKRQVLDNFNRQECFAYYGELDPEYWGQLGFAGQHRDSDALGRSNHEVIVKDLTDRFPESFVVEGSSHWLVGWVDVIRIDTRDDGAVVAAMDWQYDLEQYPVADDEHYSELEYNEFEEGWDNWAEYDVRREIEKDEELAAIMLDEDDDWLPDAKQNAYESYMFAGSEQGYHDEGIPFSEIMEYVRAGVEELIAARRDESRRVFERVQPPFEDAERDNG